MMPNSVVLPAPFGPMMPSASQRRSVRSMLSATTTAPKRLEIFSRVRMEGILYLTRLSAVGASPSSSGARTCAPRRMTPPAAAPTGPSPFEARPSAEHLRVTEQMQDAQRTYDNNSILPPVGMFGAGLLAVITSSNLSPLRCHCPATSGVLVTFFTGLPVHCTGPPIDW